MGYLSSTEVQVVIYELRSLRNVVVSKTLGARSIASNALSLSHGIATAAVIDTTLIFPSISSAAQTGLGMFLFPTPMSESQSLEVNTSNFLEVYGKEGGYVVARLPVTLWLVAILRYLCAYGKTRVSIHYVATIKCTLVVCVLEPIDNI